MSVIDRIGGAAGLGGAVYFFFLPGCVCDLWMGKSGHTVDIGPETPTAEVARTFVAETDAARASAYVGLVAVLLLVVFFARLYGALQDASAPSGWLPMVTFAGGLLMAGVLLFDIGLSFAASELRDYGGETEVLRFFPLWRWNSANLFAPPFFLALFGTTFVAWSTRAFPNWYRWASPALLVLLLLSAGVLRAPGLAVFPGTLWMFLTALVLATRAIDTQEPLAATPSASLAS